MEKDKVYYENCIETLQRMPNDYIDLVVTSPPYGNLREYNGFEYSLNKIVPLLYKKLKRRGVVIWVVGDVTEKGDEQCIPFKEVLLFKDNGFLLNDTMIYHKQNPTPGNAVIRYISAFEFIFCFAKGKPKTFNPIMVHSVTGGTYRKEKSKAAAAMETNALTSSLAKKRERGMLTNKKHAHSNVFSYKIGSNQSTKDKYAFKHPAIYPEALAKDQIITWSSEGELVYDPFMGSGTTAKMCILTGRRYIGSEISVKYKKIIDKRIGDALQRKTKEYKVKLNNKTLTQKTIWNKK